MDTFLGLEIVTHELEWFLFVAWQNMTGNEGLMALK
jgi:hypothetical protein